MTRLSNDPSTDITVAIIGAGFSGLAMAIKLAEAGVDAFTVFESASEVGGTWRDNTYPGCACDVPSHLYSYSFERWPRWSRAFSAQAEIQQYLRHCVDKYGLGPRIRYKTEITGATFDEAAGLWILSTAKGEILRARFLVAATGPLRLPAVPALPGLERFQGKTFHSARWDHGYDLSDKRVAVIGTGASAIQFVPQIAPKVEKLHLFQRTPPWVFPKMDRAYSEAQKDFLEAHPGAAWLYRSVIYWAMELRGFGFVLEPRLLRILEWLAKRYLKDSIPDPALRAALSPDYRVGCKRILISNDYYPSLLRDNVEVVTGAIAGIEENAILSADGTRREVDAILFGTGFDVAKNFAPVRVVGPGGRELSEVWRSGAEAYFGVAVSGFPNLFFLLGPNSGLGHNSIVFMIEAQVHLILECMGAAQAKGARLVDVLPRSQRVYNEGIGERMKRTVWQTGCKSWYLDENGKNFTIWPGFTAEYWLRTRRLAKDDFRFETR